MKALSQTCTLNDVFTRFSNSYVVTEQGSILTGLSISGRDATTLIDTDFTVINYALRNIFNAISDDVVFTAYYISADGIKVRELECKHPVAQKITSARTRFLNSLDLRYSSIYLIVELLPNEEWYTLPLPFRVLYLAYKATHDKASRIYLSSLFSDYQANTYFESDIQRLHDNLTEQVSRLKSSLGILYDSVDKMNVDRIYGLCKYLASFDSVDLYQPTKAPTSLPLSDAINSAEIDHVKAGTPRVSCLQHRGRINRYVRYLSVVGMSETANKTMPSGFFARSSKSPLRLDNNFTLVVRWRPTVGLERSRMFSEYKNEVARANISLTSIITGRKSNDVSVIEESVKERINEINEADDLPDKWGFMSIFLAFATTDPDTLAQSSTDLQTSLTSEGLVVLWESDSAPLIRAAMQPGYPMKKLREQPASCSHFTAALPFFRPSIGMPYEASLDIHAPIVFTTPQRRPYYYNPYGKRSALTIGVGPTGSGKTCTKNAISSAFGATGGIYRSLDIDAGSEAVVQLYGEDGRVFRMGESKHGFNPFKIKDVGDFQIKSRLKRLVTEQIAGNEALESRTLTQTEEINLQQAIERIMREGFDPKLQSYTAFVSMLGGSLNDKLSDFTEGPYMGIWGGQDDAIGNFGAMYGAYNLMNIDKDHRLKSLIMSEIFWRTIIEFESEQFKTRPKTLDIDEAHHLLQMPYWAKELVEKGGRTWRKHLANISIWSQTPSEFGDIKNWPALLGAAGNLFFLADPNADRKAYREIFKLTEGEIETIINLIPGKQFLLKQPELGVSTVLELLLDEEQYAYLTSHPVEADFRRRAIKEHGLDVGIVKTIEFIRHREKDEDDEHTLIFKHLLLDAA